MQRIKRTLVWLMVAALVVTLVPLGASRQAQAAPSAASYFIPDINEIRQTATKSLDDNPLGSIISRSNVYLTTNGQLTIKGTFSYVAKDTMSVKVEKLNYSDIRKKWEPDATSYTTSAVDADTNASNRFTASNLSLFSGFNRITFTGLQGNMERSDTFYVLYDKVPFVENLKVTSGNDVTLLNEGTKVVVKNQAISLDGKVQNATKVTISVNGGTEVTTSLLEDGTFFSPSLRLNAGLNALKVTIKNASDSIVVNRSVYYYDENKPFTIVDLNNNGTKYSLLNSTPTLTDSVASGTLEVQVLVPYKSGHIFKNEATYKLNSGAATPVPSNTLEEVVYGSDGATPAYLLQSFTTPSIAFTSGDQNVSLEINYSDFGAAFQGKFNYLAGAVNINKMYYLPGFTPGDVTTASKVDLNGAQVEKADFYILVETDKDPGTATFSGSYLPLGSALNLTVPTGVTGLAANQRVYLVSGFKSGQQSVKFQYSGTNVATFNANISYVSKNYIYVSNLTDGGVYHYNSRTTSAPTLKITGQYVGFESIKSAQYFVNGQTPTANFFANLTATSNPNHNFELDLPIDAAGPLVYGANQIVFVGTYDDGSGTTREIRKEMQIYIIDDNVSNILKFQPAHIPTSGSVRQAFSFPLLSSYSEAQISNIFDLTGFVPKDNSQYVTNEKKLDLTMRGSGAQTLNIYNGTTLIFTMGIPTTEENKIDQVSSDIRYDFAGNQNDFMLRIRDIDFAATGTQVYNLELINSTGARTKQRLEIAREANSYLILAPVPTVGDQIIVNKNFVHFDIEAEGATSILIDKKPATKRTDVPDRFVYDYIGLKADKSTAIKIQIVRPGNTINETVNVYYSSSVQIDSQYMEPIKTKHSIFNKSLELSFPKGTLLKSAVQNTNSVVKFYKDTQLLFGVADPNNGIVQKKDDYGHSLIGIPTRLESLFGSTANTDNFTRISQVFWISGGRGELYNKGETGYQPSTNGVPPYSNVYEENFTQYPIERKVVPSNRGSLTLTFDSNVVDEIGSTITVFRYADNGRWENIGGVVDTKKHTITVPFDEFGYYKVMKLRQGFSDITNHPWARNILNALYSKGIMNNLQYDQFGSDDQVTRGEFATLLVKGLNLPLRYDGKKTFVDVVPELSTTTYDYAHIETAARAGIVQGLSEGYFGPSAKLTRQDAAVMIARAMKLKLATNDAKLEAALAKSFLDSGKISYYARPSISAVVQQKIMSGSPVTVPGQKKQSFNFNPTSNLTRAEAGKIAVELLKKSTKIFPANLS
ncbi:S-layer homology domain-containing protein [Cohnella sp. REN36]|uniref:S-layer homology domain-containing protein n=1 Tax=Cohnella sp. REN36 TaxID=2887347 RepID=UPI001D1414D6|nr:S-layer homology domain-containing protein [Cohnella sp. REN36]MCC3374113.1 S-layer homology domain-containing protein [Cohnella sp. REN36]